MSGCTGCDELRALLVEEQQARHAAANRAIEAERSRDEARAEVEQLGRQYVACQATLIAMRKYAARLYRAADSLNGDIGDAYLSEEQRDVLHTAREVVRLTLDAAPDSVKQIAEREP